jgi:hypothetical protein
VVGEVEMFLTLFVVLLHLSTKCFSFALPSKVAQSIISKSSSIEISQTNECRTKHAFATLKKRKPLNLNPISSKEFLLASASTIALSSSQNFKNILAKLLGYIMGAGAMAVYAPIVLNLLKTKDSKGFSLQTWIFNIVGLSLSVLYPFKKGFPVSTYLELIAISIQSVAILGLICFYRGGEIFQKYLLSMAAFTSVMGAVCLSREISPFFLSLIQIFAIFLCNYANIPQIILTVSPNFLTCSCLPTVHYDVHNFIPHQLSFFPNILFSVFC